MSLEAAIDFLKNIKQAKHVFIFHPVKHLIRFFARTENVSLPHNSEVLRNVRLRAVQQGLQFAYGFFPIPKEAQDSQSGGVRKSLQTSYRLFNIICY
jgi:hypothetical protein